MNNQNDSRAKEMFDIIAQSPMEKTVKGTFQRYAEDNDADAIWCYFQNCLNNNKAVGASVEDAGKISFEQSSEQVEKIYNRHCQ